MDVRSDQVLTTDDFELLSALAARAAVLGPRDSARLTRRIQTVTGGGSSGHTRGRGGAQASAAVLPGIGADIERAEQRLARRAGDVPVLTYPEQLPVSQRKDDIAAAIRDHQVVIVAGETGSGKTTQLPKICLELGRGIGGLIGHTQPRRIAARTVAERIAEELSCQLGDQIGYAVRFTDRVGERTLVKLMTDGILLAEIQRDRDLLGYDTLIIDEAHERSLNIDFILGYLKQLLPRRPDLKVVITSATIDSDRFSRHFGDAPVIEVTGRTYPVEVRYAPFGEAADDPSDDRDQTQAICDAVEELSGEGPGDILVFLSGEREIRDTADALNQLDLRTTEVLPLYARLSAAEQHRIFAAHAGRRVVLATNVAETSLTVPGVRYVIDPGFARISRYSTRLKVQRLPIEAVSQASANQRKGRCGRVADGICIRLYAEEDFDARPPYTEPEILRTNLASVILQMTALGLGDVAAFPFVEPPDRRNVRDGVQLLEELGALDTTASDTRRRLTPLGRQLSQLPVDPRLARMVMEGDRNGCLREVIVIAAALSIQDPRERPVDKQQAADEKHRRFADKESDFYGYLNLWDYLREQQRELSSSAFRRLCRSEFLNYLRVREWQDLDSQLRQVTKRLDVSLNEHPGSRDNLHMALLVGLLSHVGLKDVEKNEYLGARGARFAVFPGSALARKPPRYVMAAELVETSRLWGRTVARIEPEWAERLGAHLVKRTYSEPHWERKRGGTVAYERVLLYGVPLVASRKIDYGRIDARLARELFLRHALVEGDWQTHHTFFASNRSLLDDVEELENRARRRDILVDDETLFDFYDARIPEHVVSSRHFDAWWKAARREQPELLTFDIDMLLSARASEVTRADYPDSWQQGDLRLALTYQFEPGSQADGVTVHVPVSLLNRVTPYGFDWQVPGLRAELATALVRALPKPLRVQVVPAPDSARAALARVTPGEGLLRDALARELLAMTGVVISRDDWQLDRVPDHLVMTFRVEDDDGSTMAEGKHLDELKHQLRPHVNAAIAEASHGIEQAGLTSWTFGSLPRTVEHVRLGQAVRGFVTLSDDGESVSIRIVGTEEEQLDAMTVGVRRLLLLALPSPAGTVQRHLTNAQKVMLSRNPHGSIFALLQDCAACAVDSLVAENGGPTWDDEDFAQLLGAVRADFEKVLLDIVDSVSQILAAAHVAERGIKGTASLALLPSLTDMGRQLSQLVFPGFVTATGRVRRPDLIRFLTALQRRLAKLPDDVRRDQRLMNELAMVQHAYGEALAAVPAGRTPSRALREVRWMVEELRVSLWAQELGTAFPVSEKRILKAIFEASGR